MRGAVTALSLSEQEVANLRAVVKELQSDPRAAATSATASARGSRRAGTRRRALRQLPQPPDEVARMGYERDGTDAVATRFPIRIDPALSSKVVCIAQVVMLGYAYGDAENAIDAVRVSDAALAVEWLEARNVAKIQMLAPTGPRRFRLGPTTHPSDSREARKRRRRRATSPPRRFRPRAGSVDPPAPALSPRVRSRCRPRPRARTPAACRAAFERKPAATRASYTRRVNAR